MSTTICPSCLARQYENGHCGKCGFAAAEYKPAKTALPMGTTIGNYQIGTLKSTSRQSQVYTAVHKETSVPVIMEEFFPNKTAGRAPAGNDVLPTNPDDTESAQRYQQACFLIEASAQKRPLKRIETVLANNTIYSVFEAVPTVSVAAQCEMMADNPYYFRDQDGKPTMTINALEIPPMPEEREYRESGDLNRTPITQPSAQEEQSPVISESVGKKSKKTAIIGIVAALVLLAAAAGVIFGMDPFGWFKNEPAEEGTPTLIISTEPTPEEATETPTQTPTPEPTPEPMPEELKKDEFNKRLRLVTELQEDTVWAYVTTGRSATQPGETTAQITLSEARVEVINGKVLKEIASEEDDEHTKTNLYIVVRKADQAEDDQTYYWVPVGTRDSVRTEEGGRYIEYTPAKSQVELGLLLWRDYSEGLNVDTMMVFAEKVEGKTWMSAVWTDKNYGDDLETGAAMLNSTFRVEPIPAEIVLTDGQASKGAGLAGEGDDANTNGGIVFPQPDEEEDGEEEKPILQLVITSEKGDTVRYPLLRLPEPSEPEPTATPEPTPMPGGPADELEPGLYINRYGRVNKNSVNVRKKENTDASKLGSVNEGDVLYLIRTVRNEDGDNWMQVLFEDQEAYIKSEFLDVMSAEDSAAYAAENNLTPPVYTPEPGETEEEETPTPEPAPGTAEPTENEVPVPDDATEPPEEEGEPTKGTAPEGKADAPEGGETEEGEPTPTPETEEIPADTAPPEKTTEPAPQPDPDPTAEPENGAQGSVGGFIIGNGVMTNQGGGEATRIDNVRKNCRISLVTTGKKACYLEVQTTDNVIRIRIDYPGKVAYKESETPSQTLENDAFPKKWKIDVSNFNKSGIQPRGKYHITYYLDNGQKIEEDYDWDGK